MALGDSFLLRVDGIDAPLRVVAVTGIERIHALFTFEVTVDTRASPTEATVIDPDAALGSSAVIELVDERAPRICAGIVDAVEEAAGGHRFTIVPRLALLGDEVDYRGFVDLDAIEIAESVLSARGLTASRRVTRALPKRAQCVQAFETSLAFVRRILAEEGIALFLEPWAGEPREPQIVFADNPAAYAPFDDPDEIPFSEAHGEGMRAGEAVYGVELGQAMVTTAVSLGDFDFERPRLDQEVAAGDGALERHEHPGGYLDPAIGKALAAARLEEAQGGQRVLCGRTTCRRLFPGATFRLVSAPRDDLAGPWLVVELEHEGSERRPGTSGAARYEARLVAVPADRPYRPRRLLAPAASGVRSATVTGPAGSEIHPDEHGRIKAHLRWDRLRAEDDASSCWIRPVQVPTSGGFFLPRVGWEVLLGFQGASHDRPYELGRLDNGGAPPADPLPGKKTRSAFGTMTTPGGGSANALRMDDTAGSEGMTLAASRDYNERTENDKALTVVADDVHSVGANRKEIIGIARSVTVTGEQRYAVSANRDFTSVGHSTIDAGSESVTVGGVRMFKVGGDYETQAASLVRAVGGLKSEIAIQEVNRHVTGVSTVLVGGSWTEVGGVHAGTGVLGASVLTAGGPIRITASDYSLKASALKETYASRAVSAGATVSESFGAAARYAVGGSLSIKGASVFFKATAKLTLKASGITVTLTPGSITVSGDFDSSEASIVTGNDVNE